MGCVTSFLILAHVLSPLSGVLGAMSIKFALPHFLEGIQTQESYLKWLTRKAVAHIKRDRNRGNVVATTSSYKVAIHEAVCESGGFDYYTGEKLDWTLLSQYNNDDSKKLKREYKKRFALLPSVDHLDDGLSHANFKICGWRTNDCKNDLSHEELVDVCKKIVRHYEKRT